MKKEFELSKFSNELIKSLESEFGTKCLVRLSLDVQLPNRLIGDLSGFKLTIESICRFLTTHLINGLVDIEITKAGRHNGSIALSVDVWGSDAMQKYNLTNNDLANSELSWLAEMPYKTLFYVEERKYRFSFKVTFSIIEKEKNEVPLEKKVLIVEDNEMNALVFSSFLEVWGLKVTVVTNGQLAVTRVKKEKFDLILMDIYMPSMNGIQATAEIRKFNFKIPIIILTASSLGMDIEEAMASGANDFLIKPVSSTMLKTIVNKYLALTI